MRVLLSVYQLSVYHLSFFVFGTCGLLLNLGCLALGWLPASVRVERFFQGLLHRLFGLWVGWLGAVGIARFRFEGFAALPRDRGLVLVANHPGLMDVTYLLSRVPNGVCIFKPAIRRNPVLGAAARRAGYLANDGGHDMLRAAAEKVAAGATLIVFPEGTRSRAGVLNPLKPGFAIIARRAGVPIQLVRIACDSDLLVKGRAWWKRPRLPATIALTLGPCLPAPESEETAAFVTGVEAWLRAGPGGGSPAASSPAFVPAARLQPAS